GARARRAIAPRLDLPRGAGHEQGAAHAGDAAAAVTDGRFFARRAALAGGPRAAGAGAGLAHRGALVVATAAAQGPEPAGDELRHGRPQADGNAEGGRP